MANLIGTGLGLRTRGLESGVDLPAADSVWADDTVAGDAGTFKPGLDSLICFVMDSDWSDKALFAPGDDIYLSPVVKSVKALTGAVIVVDLYRLLPDYTEVFVARLIDERTMNLVAGESHYLSLDSGDDFIAAPTPGSYKLYFDVHHALIPDGEQRVFTYFAVADLCVIPAFTVPTLAVDDDGDGSVTCTVTNNADQVARLYYRLNTGTAWTLHGTTLTGNGTIGDLTGLTQGALYIFQAVPYDAASTAFGAPSLCVHVRMGTTGAVSTAEQVVYALLVADVSMAAAVGTKIYPNLAPESATRPYQVLTRIDGVQEHHVRAASGCSRVRIQLDSYADTYAAAKALARLARMALDGYQSASVSDTDGGTLTNVRIRLLSDQDGFDEPIAGKGRGVHRVIQDYEVAHTDEVPVFGD